jgi:hypothetical protein
VEQTPFSETPFAKREAALLKKRIRRREVPRTEARDSPEEKIHRAQNPARTPFCQT